MLTRCSYTTGVKLVILFTYPEIVLRIGPLGHTWRWSLVETLYLSHHLPVRHAFVSASHALPRRYISPCVKSN